MHDALLPMSKGTHWTKITPETTVFDDTSYQPLGKKMVEKDFQSVEKEENTDNDKG